MVFDEDFFSFNQFKANAFIDNIKKPRNSKKAAKLSGAPGGIIYKGIAQKV
jgi:hypothetical protein